MSDTEKLLWYPIRVTYSRELKVKEYLDEEHIENFIPLCYSEVTKGEKKERKLVPVIHNLLFIRSTRTKIDELKNDFLLSSQIRYIMDPMKREPIVIPDKQMTDFIAVAGSCDEQVLYLAPTEVALKKGDLVRITGGIWAGVEGRFVRIKRGFHVVVSIEGIMAVATAMLHPSLVEKV